MVSVLDAPAMVLASPHSGDLYPHDLIAAARLDRKALRQSEDCYIDDLFGAATSLGIPMLKARVARAYLDVNREPWELDPAMFDEALPDWVNTQSPRVTAGLGTVARIVADGQPIYRRKLRFAEAQIRIESIYQPYHAALEQLVEDTVIRHGRCLLIDAHSMPSGEGSSGRFRRPPDFVLGDRNGTACHGDFTGAAHELLKSMGYSVTRNVPYAGGFTTCHYGRPELGRHCLQIEVNRALYMDERHYTCKPGYAKLREDLASLLGRLAQIVPETMPSQAAAD
ncbi:MAG TPA: N-formylglutamate amidohydrolase [Stellaceae bacterium]|nr:N-formylglutamate amidohydrolase [Stellaceae bacterium]